MADKKSVSERDICSKYITPAVTGASWDLHSQIREEVFFTKGRIIVRGKLHSRGERKFADYILYFNRIFQWPLSRLSVPPESEQHRIVAKVDELMMLCGQLKTRITEANQLQQKLADVVVEQALTTH